METKFTPGPWVTRFIISFWLFAIAVATTWAIVGIYGLYLIFF